MKINASTTIRYGFGRKHPAPFSKIVFVCTIIQKRRDGGIDVCVWVARRLGGWKDLAVRVDAKSDNKSVHLHDRLIITVSQTLANVNLRYVAILLQT